MQLLKIGHLIKGGKKDFSWWGIVSFDNLDLSISAQGLPLFLAYVGFFLCYMPIYQSGSGFHTLSFLTTIVGKKLSA